MHDRFSYTMYMYATIYSSIHNLLSTIVILRDRLKDRQVHGLLGQREE